MSYRLMFDLILFLREFMARMTSVTKSPILILNLRQFLKILDQSSPPVGMGADPQNIITRTLSSSTCCHRPGRKWQRDGYRRLDLR